ncbi:hypothetical protein C7T94_14340 [Pedobacter yulinensis]|uniref:Uncharacterized protein n=1 Tax=Pedobacter yulinensis TaxID=2126353 RepID=A0A2T3HMV2_9SPHI|nr:hypothetical protein [Pedobacter yulinensis]PST83701.1 hypothetical protein C7T94_14340 [Pedobacter yulinensis]
MKGKPVSLPVMIGPGFCFLGAYPNYFFDYTLENEFMAIDRFGPGSGVVQHVYNIKIKKVIDRDTQEGITSQVSIFPAEGINVQITKNIYNDDWAGGGNR